MLHHMTTSHVTTGHIARGNVTDVPTHRLPAGVLIVTVHSVIACPQNKLHLNNYIYSAVQCSAVQFSDLAICWFVGLHEVDSRCNKAHGGVAVVVAEPSSTEKRGGTSPKIFSPMKCVCHQGKQKRHDSTRPYLAVLLSFQQVR